MKGILATIGCAAALAAAHASAQDAYPVKPIQVVLPLQAASASDIAVRIVTERLAEILGQGVVVENVSGVGPDRHEPRGHRARRRLYARGAE